jgi:hypothetical protein
LGALGSPARVALQVCFLFEFEKLRLNQSVPPVDVSVAEVSTRASLWRAPTKSGWSARRTWQNDR